MTKDTSARADSAIDEVANEYFEQVLQLFPEIGTEMGLPGYESRYGDYSPAGTQKYAELTSATLEKLDALTAQDAVDEVTLDAMRERLGLELEIIATGRTELNNIASQA